jgi:hypothetical protein
MKYLITVWTEFYQWVEADSEEEALAHAHSGNGGWRQTMNKPAKDIKAKIGEIDTDGEVVEGKS